MARIASSPNPFNGIIIDPAELPEAVDGFREDLQMDLKEWVDGGFQVVWLEVPISRAGIVPIAAEAGFTFHHSGLNYVMMIRRLVEDAFVPEYASHYTGAGGVVINEKNELLVVCERHRGGSGRIYYKLPGGALHPGEHLAQAVVREVKEETGVLTTFRSLACFRHWHGYRYGKSDIYFVCRLDPLSAEIEIQESEIEEALWMPLEEYYTSEYVGVFNRHIVQVAVEGPGLVTAEIDGYVDADRREIFMPHHYVLSAEEVKEAKQEY
jgi:8-oxo-dGTP pyrophosphatase MutT (NUDIX family)